MPGHPDPAARAADGRLTPDLAVRAAERAGLSARLVRQPLHRIGELTLPCVLLLENRTACVLVDLLPGERALVALPESAGGTVELPLVGLAERYVGYALFARAQLRFDRRAEQVGGAEPRSWFWGTLAQAWPMCSEVLLAAVLINLFALASPLFIMNVYDRVVPNQAIETLWVLAAGVATVFVFDFVVRNLRAYFVDSARSARGGPDSGADLTWSKSSLPAPPRIAVRGGRSAPMPNS